MFKYKGDLVLSKSWLNRALVIQHYQPDLNFELTSDSEDVIFLKKALSEVGKTKKFYLGQGGTSFRFFCFLISRFPGEWTVEAHPRLLARPQKSLQYFLHQLGVNSAFHPTHVLIQSKGWKLPAQMRCEAQESSQFVSALLLNSWDLDQDLNLIVRRPMASEEYLNMSLAMLKKFGLKFVLYKDETSIQLQIAQKQKPIRTSQEPEVDVSSAFSLASAAAIDGDVEISNWKSDSIQPDMAFLNFFEEMKIKFSQTTVSFRIQKQKNWQALRANLGSSPDLFPVLAILCALADGESKLFGASQLRFKESDRLQKTKELLDLAGFRSQLKDDIFTIEGRSSTQDKNKRISFDPDHDHRMAMAAGLLKLAGYEIDISTPEVVQKSYPHFWEDIGIKP